MTTDKLYLNDALLLHFQGTVTAVGRLGDQATVCLDRSAFYGEAGGQLGDTGVLHQDGRFWTVTDCQYDDAGMLHHLLAAADDLPAVGAVVTGEVTFARRRDMMSQHTGQHLLSATFDQLLGAATVSSRLGAAESTLDLDVEDLSDAALAQVLDHAGRIVNENRPVRPLYPDDAALQAMNLRRLPKVTQNIRIIEIEGFDRTPCGGTHCSTTGQIGPLYVTATSRVRGRVRVHFLCGDRVTSRLAGLDAGLRDLGAQLGCGAAGVAEAVVKLQKDLKTLQQQFAGTRATLLDYLCKEWHAAHPPRSDGYTPLTVLRPDDDIGALRALGAALARREDVVALCVGRDPASGDWRVVLDAHPATGFDAGAWFRGPGKALGGRGGGRGPHAEGSFPGDLDPHLLRLDAPDA